MKPILDREIRKFVNNPGYYLNSPNNMRIDEITGDLSNIKISALEQIRADHFSPTNGK